MSQTSLVQDSSSDEYVPMASISRYKAVSLSKLHTRTSSPIRGEFSSSTSNLNVHSELYGRICKPQGIVQGTSISQEENTRIQNSLSTSHSPFNSRRSLFQFKIESTSDEESNSECSWYSFESSRHPSPNLSESSEALNDPRQSREDDVFLKVPKHRKGKYSRMEEKVRRHVDPRTSTLSSKSQEVHQFPRPHCDDKAKSSSNISLLSSINLTNKALCQPTNLSSENATPVGHLPIYSNNWSIPEPIISENQEGSFSNHLEWPDLDSQREAGLFNLDKREAGPRCSTSSGYAKTKSKPQGDIQTTFDNCTSNHSFESEKEAQLPLRRVAVPIKQCLSFFKSKQHKTNDTSNSPDDSSFSSGYLPMNKKKKSRTFQTESAPSSGLYISMTGQNCRNTMSFSQEGSCSNSQKFTSLHNLHEANVVEQEKNLRGNLTERSTRQIYNRELGKLNERPCSMSQMSHHVKCQRMSSLQFGVEHLTEGDHGRESYRHSFDPTISELSRCLLEKDKKQKVDKKHNEQESTTLTAMSHTEKRMLNDFKPKEISQRNVEQQSSLAFNLEVERTMAFKPVLNDQAKHTSIYSSTLCNLPDETAYNSKPRSNTFSSREYIERSTENSNISLNPTDREYAQLYDIPMANLISLYIKKLDQLEALVLSQNPRLSLSSVSSKPDESVINYSQKENNKPKKLLSEDLPDLKHYNTDGYLPQNQISDQPSSDSKEHDVPMRGIKHHLWSSRSTLGSYDSLNNDAHSSSSHIDEGNNHQIEKELETANEHVWCTNFQTLKRELLDQKLTISNNTPWDKRISPFQFGVVEKPDLESYRKECW